MRDFARVFRFGIICEAADWDYSSGKCAPRVYDDARSVRAKADPHDQSHGMALHRADLRPIS
jgi:hypothetical protein